MKIALPDADIEYIEDFYSTKEADCFFQQMQQNLQWRQDDISMFGKRVKIPRLQAWYGDSNLSYRYSNMTLTAQPWTKTLQTLKATVSEYCLVDFNAVLANLYRNQNDSVGWHSDNEVELGDSPTIASLSFGAKREFQLKHINSKEKFSLVLAPGSLLVMRGATQNYWQHCLPKRAKTIAPRINLTFRKIWR
ncbi:MAG: alpha-ketoglutarate-dependent dioxygenase AlkB family protein [Cognaticolwellia sp.]